MKNVLVVGFASLVGFSIMFWGMLCLIWYVVARPLVVSIRGYMEENPSPNVNPDDILIISLGIWAVAGVVFSIASMAFYFDLVHCESSVNQREESEVSGKEE